MFTAFPAALRDDVSVVTSWLSDCDKTKEIKETDEVISYTLADGQKIQFPYRIYYPDEFNTSSLTPQQKMIYHCIFSRSNDGYIREKHIRAMFNEGYPDWAIPYIVKVSDEYVVEIIDLIYRKLNVMESDRNRIREFCYRNLPSFLKSYARMISYWNAYYRSEWKYEDYAGTKLYRECFGYTKDMEKKG